MNLTNSKRSRTGSPGFPAGHRSARAFTLIELLAVIVIISILAALTGPIISRMGTGDKMSAGGRQLLDDLSLARSKAMATRSTVYVVFLPPYLGNSPTATFPLVPGIDTTLYTNYQDRVVITNLSAKTYSGYALFSERSLGDQPGSYSPKYLTGWRELPPGVSVHPDQFLGSPIRTNYISGDYVQPFSYRAFPFPNAENNVTFNMPYLAFNARGQLTTGANFYVQVAETRLSRTHDLNNPDQVVLGPSVASPMAPNAVYQEWENKGIAEGVNYTNLTIYAHEIEINWLTGRGKFLQPEIQ
jgi:prepilin-type N-terminal cleavage/methylation domain-containing protein